MEIVTGEQMRRIDRRAIDGLGIPSLQLMEAAGRGVATALLRDFPDLSEDGVVLICGKGNNGGDGLVAARHLLERGIKPAVLLLCRASEVRGDVAHNLRLAGERGIQVREVPDLESWSAARSVLTGPRVVVDAMLGTGIRGGPRGIVAAVIRDLNRSGCRVVSVDLPSGIDADQALVQGGAVRAHRTYTLCRPKLPLALDPAATHAGTVTVLPIGIPDDVVREERSQLDWIDRTTAGRLLPPRPSATHKGDYGHLLAVAGSRGKSGAAVLLARGALRSGVGLVTVATPSSTQELVALQQAEVMTEPLPEIAQGVLASPAAGSVKELLSRRDALAIGPGLGMAPDTVEAVLAIVSACEVPVVIDADALNALAAAETVFPLAKRQPVVLTPHPGEAARLLRTSAAEVQASRLESASKLARLSGSVVVLKGHQSLIADPDGRIAINSTGNPGMATGGSGDVLTGAVGAFLARGLSGWDAACLAVFLHGDAGDRAARDVGEDALIASDLVERLAQALRSIRDEQR